jgi:hypothetical protein
MPGVRKRYQALASIGNITDSEFVSTAHESGDKLARQFLTQNMGPDRNDNVS